MEQDSRQTSSFECIILAGGKGSRLKPVISDVPKPLAPIAGIPFLDILLNLLKQKGCQRFIISVGYMAEMIIARYGNEFNGIRIIWAKEDQPLGTGGALKLALKACHNDYPIVVNGDTFVDFDASELLDFQSSFYPVLTGAWINDTSRYGKLKIVNQNVVGFEEKGGSGAGFINAGVYKFYRQALENFPDKRPFSLEQDYLVPLVRTSPLNFLPCNGFFIDIGVPADYNRAQTELLPMINP